ncbi:putative ribonuclease H protein [Citrus sinensis]|uniref:Ribonuclease H protein n=1 Tax=Citrus sinensis TaxID=2711 RepID=A0ACB8IQ82_CITSI|nr:putative ribonuclease H protein [Citrus sinensis]
MSESSENLETPENPSLLKTIPPPLPEDRSTKKARFRNHGMDEDNPPPLSFKDALMPRTQQRSFDDTEMDEEWDFEPGDVMWHMIPDFSVIDLENNYYLIRLNSSEDAVYALTEGPWVIFGHYLTVQPWNPSFDSTVTELDSAVVWIRLPGMAFHLYDKRVLRKIGQLVGNVIKIDYRTELRERGKFARIAIRVSLTQPLVSRFNLDGRIQKVEYEGLAIICFQCVEKIGVPTVANSSSERFGPWMVVERKGRARAVVDKENITDSERNQRTYFNTTSRFAALSDDYDASTEEELDIQNPIHVPPQQPIKSITDHFNIRKNPTLKTSRTLKPHHHLSKGKQVAKPQFPKPKPLHLTASSSMHETLRPHVTKILPHNTNDPNPRHTPSDNVEFTFNLTTLDPTKHMAVTLPFRNRATARQPPSGTMFAEPAQQLPPKQLAEPSDGKDAGVIDIRVNNEGDSQPIVGHEGEDFMSDNEDTVVQETPGVHKGMMVGLSPRTFAALVKNYNPTIVAIFEPRVSGKKVDDFIKKSGFDRSHRVEANEFSGGIWVLWRDFFDVEVALNHNQFIHLKISAHNVTQAWVTAVYASPNSSRRHELCHELNCIARSKHDPWLVGGDFNSILYAEEKRGGSQLGTGICPLFNSWFHANKMVDLPFSGPRFTWVRGSLSKRLDRVLSNKDWILKFDNYSVTNLPRVDSDHRPILVRFERNGRGMGSIKPSRFLAAWMTDNRFGNFMQDNWQGNMPYAQAASSFTSKGTYQPYQVQGCFPQIDQTRLASLAMPIDKEEVHTAICQMSPLKAPGIDGYPIGFYQAQWHIVGESFSAGIKEVFNSHSIPREVSKTLLILIPKTERPTSFKMYRPISLCTVFYKTVTKIIVTRLQALLPDLVGPHQTSFVPGRHITENIIIAQEVVHSMRRKLGRKWLMAIKIDLEKAYDRLNWNFIHDTLMELALPFDLIYLIMECITSNRMNILWNGELTGDFAPSRGVRQGDALSPYIFVLCIERLSHGIYLSIQQEQWKPIRLARMGTPLSHLFFADDLLLFAEASSAQAFFINSVLEEFCLSSGAKVNKSKTQVYFSNNISGAVAGRLGRDLGYTVTKDLGTYLGMPLLHRRVSKQTYQGILDKMQQRLSGWAASQLSFAGRITLTQSVLQAIPIYAMQTTNLPASIKTKIDQVCRRFLWSGNAEMRKMSLVSWQTICQPKLTGGLGFKRLEIMNDALLLKVAWNLITEPGKLCAQVLATKYRVSLSDIPQSLPTRHGSHLWKSVCRVWNHAKRGLRWNVGNGLRVKFWWDCWATASSPLAAFTLKPIPPELCDLYVADFVTADGTWNWPKFSYLLSHNAVMRIASIHPPSAWNGADKAYWAAATHGKFTVKSAYDHLAQPYLQERDTIWRLAWSWKGPQSIKIFIWLVLHNRLKTRGELASRHLTIDTHCERCGYELETTIHVLRDCPYSRAVWLRLLRDHNHQEFFNADLVGWMSRNLQASNKYPCSNLWRVIFGVAIWRIWYWRNHFIFTKEYWESNAIALDIKVRAAEIQRSNSFSFATGTTRIERWIRWIAPVWPWVKLNSDGAKKSSGTAGASGLIRDFRGGWQVGYSANLGVCSVTSAELWGLFHGLSIAWQYGFRKVYVEVDSMCVMKLISNSNPPINEHFTLIREIQALLRRDWLTKVEHIY